MVAVIAGSLEQYRSFCHEKGINLHDKRYHYINSEMSARGCYFDDVIEYGTPWMRDDYERIKELVEIGKRRPR